MVPHCGQENGFAMGSELAVYLSNIWLRQFEPYFGGALREEIEPYLPNHMDSKHPCGKCGKTVTKRGYSAQCNRCEYWYQRACTGMSTAEMKLIKPGQWHCGCFKTIVDEKEQSKVIFRYSDDIFTCIKQNEEGVIVVSKWAS